MPRVEANNIVPELRDASALRSFLASHEVVHQPLGELVERFVTPEGDDVFVVSGLGDQGVLQVQQVTHPTSANRFLQGMRIEQFPNRARDEEGA